MSADRKGFWDFCCEHPIAAFFIAWMLFQCIYGVSLVLSGHADKAVDVVSCKVSINKPAEPEKAQGE